MMVHCSSNKKKRSQMFCHYSLMYPQKQYGAAELFLKFSINSPDRGTEEPCSMHVNQTRGLLTWNPSVHHCSPIHPQKEAPSILDLMLFSFSLLDLVTKLASPFCRRLLCAAFCCLVSCLRTFWRTTSCRTQKNPTQTAGYHRWMHALSVSARQT